VGRPAELRVEVRGSEVAQQLVLLGFPVKYRVQPLVSGCLATI
jgi:hypothetical protein